MQKNHIPYAQAQGAPAGFVLQFPITRDALANYYVEDVSTSIPLNIPIHPSASTMRISAIGGPLFVKFGDVVDTSLAVHGKSTLTLAVNPVDLNDDSIVLDTQEYIFKSALVRKSVGTLSLTGAIVPGSHAESVLTSDATAPTEASTVVVGGKTYRFTDAIIRAARLTLTNDTTDVSDGQTIILGTRTYRFKTTMAQVDDVQIDGADPDVTLGNLVAAINHDAGEGTKYYTGTTIHPSASAGAVGSHATIVTAKTAGTAGNGITTGGTATHTTWAGSATSLAGGHDDTANDVLIGISAAVALDNLKTTINGTGQGTTCGTGTVANTVVIATTNADTTQKVIARVPGTAANAGATTQAGTSHCSWPDTTLGGGTGASNPGVAPETVTIGSVTYSFLDVLSETNGAAAIANQVLFGANSAAALDNLKLAITHGSTMGTNYSTGSVVHPTVTATTNTDTSQVVEALTAGVAGNAIASTSVLANGAWGATTLAGGYDDDGKTVIIGTAASDTQTNLRAAVNGTSGSGTTYSAALTAHPTLWMDTWGSNAAAVIARVIGTSGNDIATTSDFTSGSNSFDAVKTASGANQASFDTVIPAGERQEFGIDEDIHVVSVQASGATTDMVLIEY
jgi:hypothetical protein